MIKWQFIEGNWCPLKNFKRKRPSSIIACIPDIFNKISSSLAKCLYSMSVWISYGRACVCLCAWMIRLYIIWCHMTRPTNIHLHIVRKYAVFFSLSLKWATHNITTLIKKMFNVSIFAAIISVTAIVVFVLYIQIEWKINWI